MTLEQAKYEAWKRQATWLAMDASGALWCGELRPVYHEIFPIWIWDICEQPMKVGWVYPGGYDWRESKWRVMR